jgi:hypothetical protein
MRTYIDGTKICPQCGRKMVSITYYSATVVDVTKDTEEKLFEKITETTITYTDITEEEGYICLDCGRKKEKKVRNIMLIFSAIFGFLSLFGFIGLLGTEITDKKMHESMLCFIGFGFLFVFFLLFTFSSFAMDFKHLISSNIYRNALWIAPEFRLSQNDFMSNMFVSYLEKEHIHPRRKVWLSTSQRRKLEPVK